MLPPSSGEDDELAMKVSRERADPVASLEMGGLVSGTLSKAGEVVHQADELTSLAGVGLNGHVIRIFVCLFERPLGTNGVLRGGWGMWKLRFPCVSLLGCVAQTC